MPDNPKSPINVDAIAAPLARVHELVGCSRTQFSKIYVDTGLIKPIDLGGRGRSVLLAELKEVIAKRAAAIRSGEIVPPIRSARGKASARAKNRPTSDVAA